MNHTSESLVDHLFKTLRVKKKDATLEVRNCLKISFQVMKRMNSSTLKTEHILYSLMLELHNDEAFSIYIKNKKLNTNDFIKNLKDRPLFEAAKHLNSNSFDLNSPEEFGEITMSYGVNKIFKTFNTLVSLIGQAGNCLVLFASMVLEGTTISADVILQTTKSRVNSKVIAQELGINLSKVHVSTDRKFDTYEIKNLNIDRPNSLIPFVPDVKKDLNIRVIPELDKFAPDNTNWVIYPNLLIGGNPGRYLDTIEELVSLKGVNDEDIGRHTFICLMGEYKNMEGFYNNNYPILLDKRSELHLNRIDFIYYPIHDFEVTKLDTLKNLVSEIKRRILNGERIYLHCRGGHGRTGMVVIPLVAAIYKLNYEAAAKWVRKSYSKSARGKAWRWRLPETREQEEVAKSIIGYVHHRQRGMRQHKIF